MNDKNYNYLPISILTGAMIGSYQGYKNPSEESCKKLAQSGPSIAETLEGYASTFDLKKAGAKVRSGELRLDEYKKVTDVYNAIYDTYEKEKQVVDVMNTPIEERTMTFRQAVREANKTRPNLYKATINFNKNFQDKLSDLGVFDREKFSKIYKAAAKKTFLMYKELSKGLMKGLGIGAAAGAGIGYILNQISHKE